ncbi:hypothetical protein FJZ31_26730 [Candidatus Poribacteria bacterium]|nr:hypothetical protein [Candidatus Poribacteria bacterium]
MLNIKKAITVSKILLNSVRLISVSNVHDKEVIMLSKLQKHFKFLELVTIFFLLQIIYVAAAYGADFYVSATAGSDETGDGSASNPWKTIQHAVDNTPDGMETDPTNIHVLPGVYYECVSVGGNYRRLLGSGAESTTITVPLEAPTHGDLDGDKRVTAADANILQEIVVGNRKPTPNDWQQGDINEDGRFTVHDVVMLLNLPEIIPGSSTVVHFYIVQYGEISGFTIIGGIYGGIWCHGSSLTITKNIIRGNQGCGILCDSYSSPMIISNTITENSNSGIFCTNGSSPTITDNIITGNSSLSGLSGSGCGGGIYCNCSSPTITNNTIMGNSADLGGGIYCAYWFSAIINNTITGNSAVGNGAVGNGGGIFLYYSSATITSGSITGNHAGGLGGGVFYDSGYSMLNAPVSGNTCGQPPPCDEPPEGTYFVQDVCNVCDYGKPFFYRLTTYVTPSGGGSVNLNPNGGCYYDINPDVTLTAIAEKGYLFDQWGGDASGSDPIIIITMDSDKYVIAYFVKVE